MNNILSFFQESSERVEHFLDKKFVNSSIYTVKLTEGMRYSLFAGGKRLRPALVYASYGIFSDDYDYVTPFAAAIEVIHTYSLIHDDLPAMDNDDMRRGKPSNHIAFGEAEAILAGDALLTKAFEIMSDYTVSPNIPDNIRVNAVYKLALAAGDLGMVGGQYADIAAEGRKATSELVEFIHKNKTAALIECAVYLGGIAGGADDKQIEQLISFGRYAGLAFQVIDDILDITSSSETLGKNIQKDINSHKATYPAVYSLEGAKNKAEQYIDKACKSLESFGDKADTLLSIAEFIMERKS
ncbi:polyprenyl synthetase family protein [Mucispirillum schaedleri]|jgi:geranylgeranyl diphosphate synthase type II|uniref:Farnesyl diphosphate synthase n=1 Tax=Mucispirillum schaedleri ASF457 TaxID=1379858 RepID=V2Q813_9BACT|nr:farnesyl diphosphate synthase [Mucispirillum schaedleri]MCX4360700.1 polyprenyl synthetase family protein [Mucispirillum schaedleri]USF23066.1 Farnesyl diphosphate synthase [Mucispirillum schaedleri ASF457]SIW07997.1 geranyltranstransferase [Mucispirillum schaedleri ASF457]